MARHPFSLAVLHRGVKRAEPLEREGGRVVGKAAA